MNVRSSAFALTRASSLSSEALARAGVPTCVAEVPGIESMVGDWAIFDSEGTPIGRSRIVAQCGGAMLHEERLLNGQAPESLWLCHVEARGWCQLDLAPSGWIRELVAQTPVALVRPTYDPIAMVGVALPEEGEPAALRLSFVLESADRGRRHLEISRDGGERWCTVYDYRYLRLFLHVG